MPTWEGEEYRYVLGEERAGRTWPFRSLLDKAGVLALGSDCPVVDNNPFPALHRGMTRLHDDGLPEGGWNPSQKLTLAQLLRSYTYGSAYGAGREDELGTLQPGKLADIAVCDRNLFASSPSEIRKAKVDMTIMDGKIIYKRQ
jgi:predicted amidohydrolase YtcJ